MPRHNSYTVKFKLDVINWHVNNGENVSKTSREFGVDRKRIREWISFEDILLQSSRGSASQKKRLHAGGASVTVLSLTTAPHVIDERASDDYEWQPPTEAEMKILQAKRERSDKISKLMGEYLLKGYRMLGNSCPDCGTILMQDKQKRNYCVACNELDSDTNKDDPAMNQEAARRQVAEERQRGALGRSDSPEPTPTPMGRSGVNGPMSTSSSNTPSDEGIDTSNPQQRAPRSLFRASQPPTSISAPGHQPTASASSSSQITAPTKVVIKTEGSVPSSNPGLDMSYSIQVVQAKLYQATQDLEQSSSIENSIKLCELIKACAASLGSLYSLHGGQST